MTCTFHTLRPLLLGAVVIAITSASIGCSWIKGDRSRYTESVENRPLEVPPDLDAVSVAAATQLPPAAGLGGAAAAVAGSGVQLSVSAASAYPRIGSALAAISGVTINGRAEALGSFDVNYKEQNFLVRVQDAAGGGSRLMALSPDGRILATGPAAELMGLLKAKL